MINLKAAASFYGTRGIASCRTLPALIPDVGPSGMLLLVRILELNRFWHFLPQPSVTGRDYDCLLLDMRCPIWVNRTELFRFGRDFLRDKFFFFFSVRDCRAHGNRKFQGVLPSSGTNTSDDTHSTQCLFRAVESSGMRTT